jgi:hypothetical protein
MTARLLSGHILRCELAVLGEKEGDQQGYEKRKYVPKRKT